VDPVQPRLYTDLAPWFHLLTAPDEYRDEVEVYWRELTEARGSPPSTLVELGCGGGNNAHWLRHRCDLTLTDLSPAMIAQSAAINPGCAHQVGDMRTLRLGRTYDAVLVHDAVCYMASESDLRAAIATAFAHCTAGGAALFVPDMTRETFAADTGHGGHDGADGRSLRYLEWTWDPDPDDTRYVVDMAYLLRTPDGRADVIHDRHHCGQFSRADWLRWLSEAGFAPQLRSHSFPDIDRPIDAFVAARPA